MNIFRAPDSSIARQNYVRTQAIKIPDSVDLLETYVKQPNALRNLQQTGTTNVSKETCLNQKRPANETYTQKKNCRQFVCDFLSSHVRQMCGYVFLCIFMYIYMYLYMGIYI